MNQEEFKILLSSDVGKAIPDLQSVGKAMSEMATNAEQAATSLGLTGTAVDKTTGKFVLLNKTLLGSSNEMKAFATQAKLGELSFTQFGTSAGKAVKSTQDLSKMTVNANGALVGFNNILRDAPYGIIGVGNNITQLTDSFSQLRLQTGSVGGALGAMASSIFSPVGLLTLGLSAGITLWTVYAQSQQRANAETEKAKEANKSLADILRESAASVQGQVDSSKQLAAIVADTNKSYDQRKSALNELQKISKEYFGGLSLERSNYEDIKIAVDRYTDSLVRNATVKGLQDQISKTAEAISKQAPIINSGLKSIANSPTGLGQFVDKVVKDTVAAKLSLAQQFKQLSDSINSGGKKVAADIANVGAIQLQAISKTAPYEELKDRIKTLTQALAEALGGTDTPDKTGKEIKTVTDILKELDTELTAIDVKAQAFGATAKDLGTDKINAFKKAMEELLKIGVQPGSVIFTNLQKLGEEIQKFMTEQPFNLGPQKIQVPVEIEALPATQTTQLKGLTDSFSKVFNEENGRLQYSISDIQNTLSSGVIDITDSIGQVFSPGGGIENVLVGFSGLVSGILDKVGDDMIKLGISMVAIKRGLALSFSNPALAIAAGVAAKLAASLIKSSTQQSIGNSVPAFATGGVTNGLTLGILGDNPGGREAIIPSQDWREAFNMFSAPRQTLEARFTANEFLIFLKQGEMEGLRY